MSNSIVSQTIKFDQEGWPLNPEGRQYTPQEIAADPTIPLPSDPLARRVLQSRRDQVQGKEISPPKTKTRANRTTSRRRRQFPASAVLSLERSGAEQQAEARGRAQGELVERVNDSEPLEGRVVFLQSGRRFTILEVE